MPPGTAEAIHAATQTGRWEAVALVAMMLAVSALLVWLVRHWITQASIRESTLIEQAIGREQRLDARISKLELYHRDTLQQLIRDTEKVLVESTLAQSETTRVLSEFVTTLTNTRTCFASAQRQSEFVAHVSKDVADAVVGYLRHSAVADKSTVNEEL